MLKKIHSETQKYVKGKRTKIDDFTIVRIDLMNTVTVENQNQVC